MMRKANRRITRMVVCLACVLSIISGQKAVVAADVDAYHDDDLIGFNTYGVGTWVMESSGSAYLTPR